MLNLEENMNKKIIDMHVHFGAPKDKESGCYWSEKFKKTAAYYAMLLLTKSLFKKVNLKRVKKHLFGQINSSQKVDKFVLLAMDQVYDEAGNVHPEWTHLHTPNSYLFKLAGENERILVGASVHPYRKDWEDELNYCIDNNAVLCKWIPSSQLINPEHPKCTSFYKKLARHNLPLLCHAGPEYAIPTSKNHYNEYNNPSYLRKALDLGVTVIIPHCALPYFWFFDVDYQDDYDDFLKLFEEAENNNWNLYADLSAIATPTRAPYIDEILTKIPHEKLLYGSDYPIPISEFSYNKSKGFFSWLKFIFKAMFMKNQLDKNYLIIQEMGFNDCVFTNADKLFNKIMR